MGEKAFPPIHPGEYLNDYLEDFGLSQTQLPTDIGVPHRRINEIVRGRRGITAQTALLLSRYFGDSAERWMRLQVQYDLEIEQGRIGDRLSRVRSHPFRTA